MTGFNLGFDVSSFLSLGCVFWQEYHRCGIMSFSLHPIKRHMITVCHITSDINFDHLVKTVSVSARFLQ